MPKFNQTQLHVISHLQAAHFMIHCSGLVPETAIDSDKMMARKISSLLHSPAVFVETVLHLLTACEYLAKVFELKGADGSAELLRYHAAEIDECVPALANGLDPIGEQDNIPNYAKENKNLRVQLQAADDEMRRMRGQIEIQAGNCRSYREEADELRKKKGQAVSRCVRAAF